MTVQHAGPDNAVDVPLGWELRRLRRARGLSQRQTAEALCLASHGTISDYESGRRTPPADILTAYESLFGLPEGRLLKCREVALTARALDDYHAALDGRRDAARGAAAPSADPATVVVAATAGEPAPGPAAPVTSARADEPATAAPSAPRRPARRWLLLATGGSIAALVAAALVSVSPVRAPRSAANMRPDSLASGWQERTQHVSDQQEASGPIQDMDGDDPRARGCVDDAVTLAASPFRLPDGSPGSLRLRYSARCRTEWASAYYANPRLFTVRLTATRPKDGALVRSQWSNNTPPGSYSDMLSAGSGCVRAEVSVTSPPPQTPTIRTPCLQGTTATTR